MADQTIPAEGFYLGELLIYSLNYLSISDVLTNKSNWNKSSLDFFMKALK